MGDQLDKYGLGQFAFMLGDGALPKRPSEEEPEVDKTPDYLRVSPTKFGPKGQAAKLASSPEKEAPMWVFGKPRYPHINRKSMPGAEEMTELNCGCKCTECISNYKAYWEEKSYSKDLAEALQVERDNMKEVVLEVGQLEQDYRNKLSEARLTVDVVENKHRVLEESLEIERKLRADETYRREVVNAETDGLYSQIRVLEDKIMIYNSEIITLKKQNNQLKDWTQNAAQLKDTALGQAREHSNNVDRLERDNSELRLRLYEVEVAHSKLQFKNQALKDRLAQIPDLRMGTSGRPSVHHNSHKKGFMSHEPHQLAPVSKISREVRRQPSEVPMNPLAHEGSISALSSITGYNTHGGGGIKKHFG
jgi:hypothetical protein